MKKTYSVLIVCIFVLFLAAVSVGSVVAPERTFSQMENAGLNRTLGRTDANGVYFGRDGALLERETTPDPADLLKRVGYVNTLSEKTDLPIYFGLIPSASTVWRDRLPANAETAREDEVIAQAYDACKVKTIDVLGALNDHRNEPIYFRTDHHWTALGAYYAYTDWARRAGFEPVSLDQYKEMSFEPFYGSLYYKANQSGALTPDTVYAYEPPGDVHLYIELNGKDSNTYRGYEQTLLTDVRGTDKYLCFLTGDVPLATFVNNDITDGSACLIVKNSNGNPFCYYFPQHYQYTYVIDYRKYKHRTLTQFVDYYDIDDVIFCLSSGQAQSRGGNELLKALIK